MAVPIQESAGQQGRQAGQRDRRETRFERSPWAHVAYGEKKNPRVTMWIGFMTIVVALSFPDGLSGDIQISIVETRLILKGSARRHVVSQSIDLPCPVETHPIRIEDDKGTVYILLRKK